MPRCSCCAGTRCTVRGPDRCPGCQRSRLAVCAARTGTPFLPESYAACCAASTPSGRILTLGRVRDEMESQGLVMGFLSFKRIYQDAVLDLCPHRMPAPVEGGALRVEAALEAMEPSGLVASLWNLDENPGHDLCFADVSDMVAFRLLLS